MTALKEFDIKDNQAYGRVSSGGTSLPTQPIIYEYVSQ